MSVLKKIREKSVLLIAVIGISLFAFIIGDIVQNGSSLGSANVGSVNGTDISTQNYLNQVQALEQNQQATGGQAYNQIWLNEVKKIILGEELEKVGLRLGKDQLINVIKNNPNFNQNPQFLNELGLFDINKFNAFLAQLKSNPQQWKGWLQYESQLEEFAKEQLYFNLLKGAVYTTNLEAKYEYKKENDRVAFDYVSVSYNTVNNENVKVSDEEIQKYIDANKNQFKTQNGRYIEYVFVANKPSKEDEILAKTEIDDMLKPRVVFNKETKQNDSIPGFQNTKDPIAFVNEFSEVPFDSTYYTKAELPQEFQEQLYNLAPGAMYGPYIVNDKYCLTRAIQKKNVTESVDASHILISYKGAGTNNSNLTKEQAKAKAEQILAQLQANPSSFATVADENTDDPGSKGKGGKYENIRQGQMVPAFDKYIFENPVGKLGIVETNFGFHVLKVDKITTKEAIQLANVVKTIKSSSKTEDELFAKATKFENDARGNDFSKTATNAGLTAFPSTRIDAFGDKIPGVETSQSQAIQWVYSKGASVGDIKKFDTNEGHLIVKITDINDTGLMTVTEARGMVEPILMNEKKAEIIKKKMTGKSLEDVAKANNVTVMNAETNGKNPLVGTSNEPKVVGTAFGIGANKTSSTIDGSAGVFMVRTKNITKAPELPNYNAFKGQVITNNRQLTQNYIFGALYNKADIEDNRTKVLR